MKRLIRKEENIKLSRLKRKIHAEWIDVDVSDPNLVQMVTDAMATSNMIQINYSGSGWRNIQPYGWNSSKEGNILLMCYKDTGEIRSYRLDRVEQVMFDSVFLQDEEYVDEHNSPDDYQVPELPNMDEIIQQTESEEGNENPYDEALDYFSEGNDPFAQDNLVNNQTDNSEAPNLQQNEVDNNQQEQNNVDNNMNNNEQEDNNKQ